MRIHDLSQNSHISVSELLYVAYIKIWPHLTLNPQIEGNKKYAIWPIFMAESPRQITVVSDLYANHAVICWSDYLGVYQL